MNEVYAFALDSLAAMSGNRQHGKGHVPYPVGGRRKVVPFALLPPPGAAEVRAIYSLQLVHVVVLRALESKI